MRKSELSYGSKPSKQFRTFSSLGCLSMEKITIYPIATPETETIFADRKMYQWNSENMFLCVRNNNFKVNNLN